MEFLKLWPVPIGFVADYAVATGCRLHPSLVCHSIVPLVCGGIFSNDARQVLLVLVDVPGFEARLSLVLQICQQLQVESAFVIRPMSYHIVVRSHAPSDGRGLHGLASHAHFNLARIVAATVSFFDVDFVEFLHDGVEEVL